MLSTLTRSFGVGHSLLLMPTLPLFDKSSCDAHPSPASVLPIPDSNSAVVHESSVDPRVLLSRSLGTNLGSAIERNALKGLLTTTSELNGRCRSSELAAGGSTETALGSIAVVLLLGIT